MFGRPDGHISRLTAQHRNQPTLGWLLQPSVRRALVARVVRPYLGLHLSTSGCSTRRILVYAANKQGKNVACIVCAPCGSLWRRDGSVWHFRPLESDAGSPYICTQATGRTTRLHAVVEIGSPAIRPRTDFYVHRNIARCVSSYSILFGLLPKTLPLQGAGLSLRSRAATRRRPSVCIRVVAYVAQPLNP